MMGLAWFVFVCLRADYGRSLVISYGITNSGHAFRQLHSHQDFMGILPVMALNKIVLV